MITQDNYMIRKHGQVAADFKKIKREYIKRADSDGGLLHIEPLVTCWWGIPQDESTDFVAYAREMAAFLRNTIFIDQVGRLVHGLYRSFTVM